MRTFIDVGSWNRRYTEILANGRNRAIVAGVAAAVLLVGVLALGWTVRRALVGAALALPPRDVLTFGGLSYASGALHVDGLRITDPSAGASLDVPHVDLAGIGLGALIAAGGPLDLTLHSPSLRLGAAGAAAGAWRSALRSLQSWLRWEPGLRLSVEGGVVDFGQPADVATPQVSLTGIAGNLSVGEHGALTYDADATCNDGDQTYPVHGTAGADPGGTLVHRWTADALGLPAVTSLLGTAPDLAARGGTLRDVRVTFSSNATGTADDPQLHATAHLDGGDFTLATGAHEIRGLHGGLTVVDDGLASARLEGTIDGVPLDVAGEVHDLHHEHFRWLADGSDDMRTLVSLLTKVAAQDHVRGVRLETVAPGLALAQFSTIKPYGPLVVTAVSIDPKEPTIRFDTVLANDHLTSGGERTSAMGVRTGAVLGINGDYYDIGGSWAPQGMVIRSGVLLRTPIERQVLTIHRDGRVTFGEYHFSGTVHVGGRDLQLTQLNNWPAGDVTFMTPEFGGIPPAPQDTLAELAALDVQNGRFRIVRAGPALAKTSPTYALAFGPLVHAPPLHVGEEVRVRYSVTPSADGAVAAIGGGPLLLRNGEWYEDPHPPAPDERDVHWAVVALGRMADDSLMIFQVDGRHPERSIGMTRPDFADLMRGFGVQDAMALDSGGSSTIVSRAPADDTVTVRNHPSDNDGERWVSNGLFVYSSAPAGTLLVAASPTPAAPAQPSPSLPASPEPIK